MKPDIKLNNDSVEVEGPLKLQRIIGGGLTVTGGMTVVGVEEHIANGFTHLVMKPDSLVFETFHHPAGVKRFDVKKEIGQNAADVKQVAADVKAINARANWKVGQLQATAEVTVGPPVESLPANTHVPQVVITGNKIAVRTVKQPGPIKIPGSGGAPGQPLGPGVGPPPGTPAGPIQIVSEFDLVADNQNLKRQVAVMERQVAALERQVALMERRLSVLENKVK